MHLGQTFSDKINSAANVINLDNLKQSFPIRFSAAAGFSDTSKRLWQFETEKNKIAKQHQVHNVNLMMMMMMMRREENKNTWSKECTWRQLERQVR